MRTRASKNGLSNTESIVVLLLATLLFFALPAIGAAQDLSEKYKVQQEKAKQEEGKTEVPGMEVITQVERPTMDKAVDPDKYILGPDDMLIISLVGPETRSFSLRVLPEGYAFVPEIGAVYANGLTLTEFRKRLSKVVSNFFHDIEVHCYLSVPRTFRVFVSGEVENPGGIVSSAVDRVSDAILKAGGFKNGASSRCIKLIRGQDTVMVDLERFFILGDISKNPYLNGGDGIVVPPMTSAVLITGEIERPGKYELLPGESIADILKLAGGFTSKAITDSLLLTRTKPDGKVFSRVIHSDSYGEKLKDQDEISIFNRLKNKRVVYVSGAFRRTGVIYLSKDERLADLLTRVGGFLPNANLSKIYIERKDGRMLSFDIRDCLPPDPAKGVELEDGDAVEVPYLMNKVTVGGEVNMPGEYPYRGDWTVAQYIGIAGGPTKDGSINRVVIYSSDGKARKARRDEKPGRGDAIIVKRSRYRILGEIFSGIIRLGTVVVTIIVLTK